MAQDPRLEALRRAIPPQRSSQGMGRSMWESAAVSELGPADMSQGRNMPPSSPNWSTMWDTPPELQVRGQGPDMPTLPQKPGMFRDTSDNDAYGQLLRQGGNGNTSAAVDGLQGAMPGSIQDSQPSASPSASWQRTPGGTGTSGTDWASAQGTDPRISGKADVESLVRDMGRNLDMEKKFPGDATGHGRFTSGATPTDVNYFQSLLSGSPDFGDDATARDQKTRDSYDTAVSEGFRGGQDYDPVAKRAEYGRQAAQDEINIPLKQTQATADSNVKQQEIESKGNLDVANSKAAADANFMDRLGQLQSKGVDVSRISTGGRSASFAPQQSVPQGVIRDVTAAHQAVFDAKAAFGESSPEVETAYSTLDAALDIAFGQDPAPTDMKMMAFDIKSDPELAGLDVDTAVQHPNLVSKYDNIQLSAEERDHLYRLLSYDRGR